MHLFQAFSVLEVYSQSFWYVVLCHVPFNLSDLATCSTLSGHEREREASLACFGSKLFTCDAGHSRHIACDRGGRGSENNQ